MSLFDLFSTVKSNQPGLVYGVAEITWTQSAVVLCGVYLG